MRFYAVDEPGYYYDKVIIGYYPYHSLAWQEFQKFADRRLIEFESIDGKKYEPVKIWEHELEEVE